MNDLPPANTWQPAQGCSSDGPSNPAIVYSITLTGVPATIFAAAAGGYVWSLSLNDGGAPPNFTIDRFDGAGNLIDHPIEVSGVDGSTTFNDSVYLNADPSAPLQAATKQYVDASSLTGQDVPAGMGICGRQNVAGNGSWTPLAPPALGYLPLAGGYLSGAIGFNGPAGQRFVLGSTASPGNLGRWMITLGDTTAESGGNAGSNFVLTSYNDLGQGPTAQLTMTRNGMTTLGGSMTVNGKINLNGLSNLTIGGGNTGDTIITDGAGNLIWGSGGSGAGIPDAPLTGGPYGRQAAAWVVIPPPPIATDAPSNGSLYGRNNGAWAVVPPPVITADAPAIGQLYGRYNNGWVQVGQQFVAIAGGNMTGPLVFNGTPANRAIAGMNASAMRWALNLGDQTPETGGNSGSNWTLQRYADNGALIDTPVTISRASGQMTVANPVTVPNPPPGDNSSLVATTSWVNGAIGAFPQPPPASTTLPLMNGTAAVGTSTAYARGDHVHPSDSTRLATAGGTITGTLGVNGILTEGSGSGAAQINLNGAAGNVRAIVGETNGVARWNLQLGNSVAESGSNAGSNFSITRFNDAGAAIDTPFQIARSNGQVVISGAPPLMSNATQPFWGVADGSGATRGQFYWQSSTNQLGLALFSPAASAFLNNSGQFQTQTFYNATAQAYMAGGTAWTNTACDARIKTVQSDYTSGLDEVLQLQPRVFVYKGNDTPTERLDNPPFSPDGSDVPNPEPLPIAAPYPASPMYQDALNRKPYVGFIAQELEQIFPGMVSKRSGFIDGEAVDDQRGINMEELTFALVNAVKTLAARVAELEAARG